jgi:ATP-binding cassette subfamily F protein uup
MLEWLRAGPVAPQPADPRFRLSTGAWMDILLSCRDLARSYGLRTLFRGITFGLFEGERTGLIGPNGAGKSTLLRILAGLETPDAGELTLRRGLTLGYVPQEDLLNGEQTVEQSLVAALPGDLDVHERHTQAAILLGKIGFPDPDQPVGSLSGGWQKRLALGRQLIRKPDLLLLDEPTNHLDVEGICWLEQLLTEGRFACLMVSHDRRFLENVANRVVELSRAYPDGFLSFNGAYSDFLRKREEFMAAQASREQSVAGKVRREIEWLQRKAKARTTKARARIDEAGRLMEELAELKVRNAQQVTAQIDFSGTQRQSRKLITANGVAKRLGGRLLFSEVHFTLGPGSRLGLLGPNGSGKTTLLRLITGQAAPDSGDIWRADDLRIVAFDQNREQLDKTQTLRRTLAGNSDVVFFNGGTLHITAYARRFLFGPHQLDMPVGEMSGGEQARILIARLMLRPADVLVLDEPTNDLDIPTLDVLEESLQEFPGALVLVTHDRYLLERISTELLALEGDGRVGRYTDLSQWEYAREQAADRDAARSAPRKAASPRRRAPAAPVKGLNWAEEQELDQMEARITAAESALEACAREVADPAVMADHLRLGEACDRLHQAQGEVDALYARWTELEAKRDAGNSSSGDR